MRRLAILDAPAASISEQFEGLSRKQDPMPGAMQTATAAVLVYESQPFWAPALQRAFADEPVYVWGCDRLNTLDEALRRWPRAVIVADGVTDPAGLLTWLAKNPARNSVTIAVCGSASSASFEPLFREVGVASYLPDLIPIGELASRCRRWLSAGC